VCVVFYFYFLFYFFIRYITIHWDKIQRDAMGTATYRYNNPRKHGLLAVIPPDVQVSYERAYGVVYGVVWCCVYEGACFVCVRVSISIVCV
jgi:hypothetical protein